VGKDRQVGEAGAPDLLVDAILLLLADDACRAVRTGGVNDRVRVAVNPRQHERVKRMPATPVKDSLALDALVNLSEPHFEPPCGQSQP